MTSDELDTVERQFGLRLPADYRATMTSYPFPPDSPAAELWVLDDLPRLLDLNQGFRQGSLDSHDWPSHLLVVGDDGGEEAFVLDTSTPPFPVLTYEIETGRLRPAAPDFKAFIEAQWADLALIKADERAMNEAYRNKKWWQFWLRPYPPTRAT